MRRLMTVLAFVGGLLGLGNYISDGWTTLPGGHNYYGASNTVSVALLTVAGIVSAVALLRSRRTMPEEEKKDYLATLLLSVAALALLGGWMLFRLTRAA